MKTPLVEWRGPAKLQPWVRTVILVALAVVALTMAYPMSARRSGTAPAERIVPRADASARPATTGRGEAHDPQLSFSMRTVVYPTVASESQEGRKATVGTGVDTAPEFEGYITQPATR
jgi:hypothetical protein